jgi:hypothetical protein
MTSPLCANPDAALYASGAHVAERVIRVLTDQPFVQPSRVLRRGGR